MKLLGVVAVCGLATGARADPPRFDPFAYPHGRPATLKPGPELVTAHAAPVLSAPLAREIEATLDLRGVAGGQLTESGDRMYYTSSLTGTAQVWRQAAPGKYPTLMTAGEAATRVLGIAGDASFVVVSRGAENPGLYLLSPAGGPLRVIVHAANVQTELGFISEDSRGLYFLANDRTPDSFAIYRFDIKTGAKQLVFDRPGLWEIADHRGDEWLLAKRTGTHGAEIYRYSLANQQLTPILGQNETERYDVAFGAHANEVLVRTDKLGEFARLYTYDGHELTPVGAEVAHEVDSFAIDDARTRIYYTTNVAGDRKLTVLDARTFKPIALPAIPDAESVKIAAVTHNGRFAQLEVTGASHLPMAYVLDWQTRKLVAWRAVQTPEVAISTFVKAELETFPARDGVAIPMFVRRPAKCVTAATPCPVLVRFHDGPEAEVTAELSPWAQLFVDHGFIVVEPNVRGSTGYGKAWLHADDGPKRLDVITDVEDVALHVKKAWAKHRVAPKIGVTGTGYGGYATLIAMSLYAGAYDAGAAEVGMANLGSFVANAAPSRRLLRVTEYGDPVKDKLALEKLSPINYVDRIKAPLLLIQPAGDGIPIYDALQARKIDGRLILFPDDGADKRGNVVLAIGHALAFFEQHLK